MRMAGGEDGRRGMKKLMLLIMILSFLSCSGEKTAPPGANRSPESGGTNGAPATGPSVAATGASSIEVVPREADRRSRLSLVPKGLSIAGAKTEWLVNGTPSGSAGNTFDPVDTARGDSVQARVTINGKEMLSNVVEIQDTPPEFTRLKIMPEVFKPGDRLYVEAEARDIDGDQVTIYYEWAKNGAEAGKNSMIASPLERGDKIVVTVTAYDGKRYGQSVVFEREIANIPPMIAADGEHHFDGETFSCQMHGTDPDGDPLTWSLKAAPSGMTINPATGSVTWQVPPEFTGKPSFTVSASDSHGGQAVQTFNLSVGEIEK
jgi:hypothetical protein